MLFPEMLGKDRAAADSVAKLALVIWAISLIIGGILFGSKGFAGVMLIVGALTMIDLLITILRLFWRIKDN
ncbi:hypothetical protein LCGC14_2550660 [marine sediment metagenome]|uniref:Uncharacterized protein n=1 Tax=marine sediment metagenome TaxID=412755 RepID=A0A0F9AMV6_9ZZZZ